MPPSPASLSHPRTTPSQPRNSLIGVSEIIEFVPESPDSRRSADEICTHENERFLLLHYPRFQPAPCSATVEIGDTASEYRLHWGGPHGRVLLRWEGPISWTTLVLAALEERGFQVDHCRGPR